MRPNPTFSYTCKHVPSGNIYPNNTDKFHTRADFLAALDGWNRSNPDMWAYEETKEVKLRRVRITRKSTVTLDVDILAETDEQAEQVALQLPDVRFNFAVGKETDVTHKARVIPE